MIRCRRARQGRPAACAGQALVETLVASLALLPLLVAVLAMGRWHDLQHTTIAAARYAAFESHAAAGRDASTRIATLTRERLYTRAPERFRSTPLAGDVATIGASAAWREPLRQRALLPPEPGPEVQLATVAQPATVERVEQQAFTIIAPARAAGTGELDLQRAAARRATVRVPLRGFAWPASWRESFAATAWLPAVGAIELRESLVLLVDPWSSGSARDVRRRTDALSAAGPLRELVEPVRPLRWAVSQLEPAFERLCLGRIEPDIVPADRLLGGNRLRFDLRSVPCG